jgi:nucleoid-associated protein YgaU
MSFIKQGQYKEFENLLTAAGLNITPVGRGIAAVDPKALNAAINQPTQNNKPNAGAPAGTPAIPPTPQPATPQPATQQPATQQPATPQPATPQPATQQSATQQPATQQSATPAGDQTAGQQSVDAQGYNKTLPDGTNSETGENAGQQSVDAQGYNKTLPGGINPETGEQTTIAAASVPPGTPGTPGTPPAVVAPGWQGIYQMNKKVIGPNPNLIKPGQKLTMPNNSEYIVKPGDNLSKIAANYNRNLPEELNLIRKLAGL